MMQTHVATRIEVIIETPAARAVTRLLDSLGVKGYTVIPVLGGRGESGAWSREGEVGLAGGMVMVVVVVGSNRKDEIVAPLFSLLKRQMGLMTLSECEVVRPEKI